MKERVTMQTIRRLAAAAATATVLLAGAPAAASAGGADDDDQDADSGYELALDVLDRLEVAEDGDMADYDRAERFDDSWRDFDDTGCTTREDILIRDLDPETISVDGDCRVEYGEATDPYTAQQMEHVLGESEVDIEHVVAAGQAWRNGAEEWTDAQRQEFYHDKDNLVAVSSAANQSKSDLDIGDWLPENQALYCDFAGTKTFIKDKYDLSVNAAEHAELERILSTGDCEDTVAGPAESLMHGEQTEPTDDAATDEVSDSTVAGVPPEAQDPYADGSDNGIDENLGMWGIIIVGGLLLVGTVARGVFRSLLRPVRR